MEEISIFQVIVPKLSDSFIKGNGNRQQIHNFNTICLQFCQQAQTTLGHRM